MNAIAVFLLFDLGQYFLAVSLEHAGKSKNDDYGTLLVRIRCTYRMGICGGAKGSPSLAPILCCGWVPSSALCTFPRQTLIKLL